MRQFWRGFRDLDDFLTTKTIYSNFVHLIKSAGYSIGTSQKIFVVEINFHSLEVH